jgi:hypothetical protein
MEHIIEDLAIKAGSPLPIIGGAVVAMIVFGVWAYKAWDGDAKPLAVFLAVIALCAGVSVVNDASKAEAACKHLYRTNPTEYSNRNCDLLVQCTTTTLGC